MPLHSTHTDRNTPTYFAGDPFMTTPNKKKTPHAQARPEPHVYKKAGCYNFTGVVFVPRAKLKSDPNMPVSLANASLPIDTPSVDEGGAAGYRHPNVIPVLSDNNFGRIAPQVQEYAQQNELAMLPVLFFYRPKELDAILGQGGLIKDLPAAMRGLDADERVFIDLNSQTEAKALVNDIRNHCVAVLNFAGIELPEYATSDNARIATVSMLSDFPFLVHHVFHALPELRVLRHRVKVLGKEQTINHIKYDPECVQDIDTERLRRLDYINVTP